MRGIRSKWATDGYKLTMGLIMRHLNINMGMRVQGRYMYVDRDRTQNPRHHAEKLRERLEGYASLSPEPQIADYVTERWSWMDPRHVHWYDQIFSHDTTQLDISQDSHGNLRIITEGPIHTATHWEIPILREDSCLLTEELGLSPKPGWIQQHTEDAKFLYEQGISYAEGGGRRPFSAKHHYDALDIYAKYRKGDNHGGLIGTSFFNYAYDLNLMPIGTMGHELMLLMAGIYGYEKANKMAMEFWIDHFGKAGYFLPDTFTTEYAAKDFDLRFANFFMGIRQDSGDPKWFTDFWLNHYRKLGINPEEKTIIYSNSIYSRNEIVELRDYRRGQIKKSNLYGKFITNRCGHRARNTVSKLVAVKVGDGTWRDVAKLSDDPGKAVGKPEEIAKLQNLVSPSA